MAMLEARNPLAESVSKFSKNKQVFQKESKFQNQLKGVR